MTLLNVGILGVRELPPGAHLCALHSGPEERYEILYAFLREGLRVGDTCRCFVDDLEPGAIRARAITSFGRFDVFPDDDARNAHLAGGVGPALSPNTGVLFSEPQIETIDVLADKLPSGRRSTDLTDGLLARRYGI